MIETNAKIIKASAGTGKTYTLSLEYIKLIIKLGRESNYIDSECYKNILVITFTRKATAEIKERIQEHLCSIINRNKDLLIHFDTFSARDFGFLEKVHKSILINKHLFSVSTIDGFLNRIFQSVVAPCLNISEYTIEEGKDKDLIQYLLELVISDETIFRKFKVISNKYVHKGKDIHQYKGLIRFLCQNRWLIEKSSEVTKKFDIDNLFMLKKKLYAEYRDKFSKLCIDICAASGKIPEKIFKQSPIKDLCVENNFTGDQLIEQFQNTLSDFFLERNTVNLDPEKICAKVAWKKEPNSIKEYSSQIYPLLLLAKVLEIRKEQEELLDLAAYLFSKYDEYRFNTGIFTYNDISYYCYKVLYEDSYSFINADNITNVFYEFLTSKIRFALIDEFQDTSVLQWSILYPILHEIMSGSGQKGFGGFIVVGDEKQSIYSWRGGERKLLDSIEGIFKDYSSLITKSPLTKSYRSKSRIIEFCNKIFSENSGLSWYLKRESINWHYSEVSHNDVDNAGFVKVVFDRYSKLKKYGTKADCYKNFIDNYVIKTINDGNLKLGDSAIIARTNGELLAFCNILNKHNIKYVYESSNTIIKHQTIKPFIYLMKYLTFFDFTDFLAFLRSDIVGISPQKLQNIMLLYSDFSNNTAKDRSKVGVNSIAFIKLFESELKCDEISRVIGIFLEIYEEDSFVDKFEIYLSNFRIDNIFDNDIAFRNIDRFLELLIRFENSEDDYKKNGYDLLRYFEDNEKNQDFTQLGLEESDAITLITVHKSKGLEFNNVFYYIDTKPKHIPENSLNLNIWYNFDNKFKYISDSILFTQASLGVLRKIEETEFELLNNIKSLYISDEERQLTEEINTFYVALTRAKSNLVAYLTTEAKDFDTALKASDSFRDNKLKHLYCTMYTILNEDIDTDHCYSIGKLEASEEQQQAELVFKDDLSFVNDYVNLSCSNVTAIDANDFCLNKMNLYKDRSALIGNIVHDYLANIYYNTSDEHILAYNDVMRRYRNYIDSDYILMITTDVKNWIEDNIEFYSVRWDRIFNEYTLFDLNKQEVRLDRMMIDTSKKEVMIIDYKTGGIHDKNQLEDYKNLITSLAYFKNNNYMISTKYCTIKIGTI